MTGDTVTLSDGKVLRLPYRDWLRPMEPLAYMDLRADVMVHGIRVPVVIDQDDNLIDGHHRIRAAWEMGIPWSLIPHQVVRPASDDEREAMFRSYNEHRRHLSREDIADSKRRRDERIRKRIHEDGASTRQVAKEEGVAQETVRRAAQDDLRKSSCATQPSNKRKPNAARGEEVRERIRAMQGEGRTVDEMSKETDLSPRTVQYHLREMQRARTNQPSPAKRSRKKHLEEMKRQAREFKAQSSPTKSEAWSFPAAKRDDLADLLATVEGALRDDDEDLTRAAAPIARAIASIRREYLSDPTDD